jgi:hypothetical protein
VLAADAEHDPWTLDAEQQASFGCSMTRATAYLLGLWGFPEGIVAAIAEQPAQLGSLSATPAAQLLTVARWRSGGRSGSDVPIEPGGYVTADRLARWDEATADLAGLGDKGDLGDQEAGA